MEIIILNKTEKYPTFIANEYFVNYNISRNDK